MPGAEDQVMKQSIVVMGVAGCGKSSLGAALAQAERMRLIEGDEFHPESNRDKMRRGIALNDEDRWDWLDRLAVQLRASPEDAVLTCSALKRAYRERLRAAVPGLRFVFMEIDPSSARARLEARSSHFFSPTLIDSQFAALESPVGEPGVLRIDALMPLSEQQRIVSGWLREIGV
jgi:gluconokinase